VNSGNRQVVRNVGEGGIAHWGGETARYGYGGQGMGRGVCFI
jgi:hypothetical protein